MTMDIPKKEHHHHGGHHHHGKVHTHNKPESATTEDTHHVAEAIADKTLNSSYANEELKALREELEIESKMR